MKAKRFTIVLAALLCLALLAACNQTPEETGLEANGPTSTPSATPTVSPTPEPTATPLPTPIPDGPVDDTIGESFADLGKAADVVLRGTYVKKLAENWNAVRYLDDPTKPDPDYFIWEEQYEFKITEIYKNQEDEPFKVGDVILVNLPYSEQLQGKNKAAVQSPRYMEVELEKDIVIFLAKDEKTVPDMIVWYPDIQPYHFDVVEGKLFARSYDEKVVTDWNATTKTEDGVPLANLKRDLEVK